MKRYRTAPGLLDTLLAMLLAMLPSTLARAAVDPGLEAATEQSVISGPSFIGTPTLASVPSEPPVPPLPSLPTLPALPAGPIVINVPTVPTALKAAKPVKATKPMTAARLRAGFPFIGAERQKTLDQGRRDILLDELVREQRLLASANDTNAAPDVLHRHTLNIAALERELGALAR